MPSRRRLAFCLAALATLFLLHPPSSPVAAATTPGVVTSLSGSNAGDGGPAVAAWLNEPESVAVDGAGAIYVADTKNCVVRKVSPNGVITTIAGTGKCGFNGDLMPATSAELTLPRGVSLDSAATSTSPTRAHRSAWRPATAAFV